MLLKTKLGFVVTPVLLYNARLLWVLRPNIRGQVHRNYPVGYPTQECFSFLTYKLTSPRPRKGVRTQFQGRACQIFLTKDHHLTSITAKLPFYLCRHTSSKRKEIEDRAWRHFKEHKKSFLYPTNFI